MKMNEIQTPAQGAHSLVNQVNGVLLQNSVKKK